MSEAKPNHVSVWVKWVPRTLVICVRWGVGGSHAHSVVDRKEFAAFMLEKERMLRAAFGSMRKDHNGAVDPADFALAMRQFRVYVQPGLARALRRSAVTQLVRTVDSDCDGVITYDECVAHPSAVPRHTEG